MYFVRYVISCLVLSLCMYVLPSLVLYVFRSLVVPPCICVCLMYVVIIVRGFLSVVCLSLLNSLGSDFVRY